MAAACVVALEFVVNLRGGAERFFQQIGLNVGLSPTRSNGFASLLKQIYLYARVFDAFSKK